MNARTPVLLVVLLLFGGAVSSCSFVQTPVAEQIEYVIEGEQAELRDPMRAVEGPPRVLIFAFDGVGRDEMRRAVDKGHLVHISEVLGQKTGGETYRNAFMANDAMTILPSLTVPAWTSIYTGRPPSETGVSGNEWFNRRTRSFLAPAPVTVSDKDHMLRVLTDNLLNNQIDVPTLFQMAKVRSFVSMAQIHAGADLFTRPDLDEFIPVLAAAAQGILGPDQVEREVYAELDEESADAATDAIEEYGVPDLQVVYFPGLDLYTHVARNPLESQREYMAQVIDPAVGEVLAAYRDRNALEETYVLFISDHGHTPVKNDDRHSLSFEGGDEPPKVLRRAGFRVRPPKLDVGKDDQDYQAVMAYQGAMAYIYLADRSTCPKDGMTCNWDQPPRFEEDVMEVVRAYHANNAVGATVPQIKGTLDLILAREPVRPGEETNPYQVYDGQELVPVDEYVEEYGRDDLLDLDRRLRQLAQGPYGHRAGDVLLLTKTGLGRRIDNRYYFSHPYRSWHGSAHEEDSMVPLVLARPGMSGEKLESIVQEAAGERLNVLDITPLVLRLLGQDPQLSDG